MTIRDIALRVRHLGTRSPAVALDRTKTSPTYLTRFNPPEGANFRNHWVITITGPGD
jgi:hypothetical protein